MRKGQKGKVGGSKRRLSPSVRCFVQAAAEALDKNPPNPSLITMPVKSEILTAAATAAAAAAAAPRCRRRHCFFHWHWCGAARERPLLRN